MRPALLAILTAGLASGANTSQPAEPARALVARYCLACHSTAKHTGDIDLERPPDTRTWQKVVEQVSLGEMPPKAMPQPSDAERAKLLDGVRSALAAAARARAGDPGPVVLRRLNNSEYTFTIRDLTGVASLSPAQEFPADGAAGEGFLNTGNALAMSPSLVTKYMDAAKAIAAHTVLLPDGLRFSLSTTRRDWTEEILSEIRNFYQTSTEAGGIDTVTQQGIALDKNRGGGLPLKKYLLALLGGPAEGLSPKYLASLKALLNDTRPSPLMDGLRALWRTAKPSDVDGMVAEIARWQQTLWKFSSVGHIGKVGGPKAWMEPVNPIVDRQEFRVKLAPPAHGNEIALYLAAHNAGDGAAGDVVTWREPKLVIAGRPPVLLREVRGLVEELTARRARLFAATAKALNGDAGVQAEDREAWTRYLGLGGAGDQALDRLTAKIDKLGAFDAVRGWGATKTPMIVANSSNEALRVPGQMRPHGVAVHPSQTLQAAVGWRSRLKGPVRVEGHLQRAHPECGNGVTWSVELRRGQARQYLANGEARNAARVPLGPFENVHVQPGDLISLLIGPRDGNHSCDLTDVDLHIAGAQNWSLSADISGDVLAANPHGAWHFYTEPVAASSADTILPAGSLLARWQIAGAAERPGLASQLERLLTGPPPAAGPDALLHRQLMSLTGPLFAAVTTRGAAQGAWGLDPKRFDGSDLRIEAPSVVEIRLPADLAAASEFVTTAVLDQPSAAEGSVQVEVVTSKPTGRAELLAGGTAIGDAKGLWSSNNQTVAFGMPVIVRPASAARKRMEAAFEQFRQMFPAALCYTKIVPVDEVVTLTLFHREDEHLSRLVLDAKQKARLDRLWEELHYVSRDALTLVDAFEQLWQYATQDADPSAFEPLRQPILARAATFREQLTATEPRHIDAVVKFAGRAYRRPLTAAEESQIRGLYGQLRGQDLPHEDAIRLMLARVLVAPAFLYRAETAPAGKTAAPVGDYEIASRLSYFLWSSMPDDALRTAAASGALRTAAGLQTQARRMLKDARVRRLATEFGAAWLHLHDFESLDEKSERHFPTFRDLRGPMFEETIRFFTDLFNANRSVLSLLDSDHTFLNEPLAKHYGIPGVSGPEWRRVEGIGKHSRGGILGQASVLSRQAGASRTSPILRGNWILEVLLGEKMPRPPKNVPQLPTDEATESLTVRELTEKHSSDARCAGCHRRMDPYGYTLEHFDAIGRYREKDLGNRPIHARATLRGGVEADGLEGLRGYLLTRGRTAFVRQFCRKLLGFSLGRAVQLSDEPLLDAIGARLEQSGYHVGTAIDMILASRQFREIRGRDHEPDHE